MVSRPTHDQRLLALALLSVLVLLALFDGPDAAQGARRRGRAPRGGRPLGEPVPARGLVVQPTSAWRASGTQGGPVLPRERAFVLANAGDRPLRWSALSSVDWLQLAPERGEIAPGERLGVRAEIAEAVLERLGPGRFAGQIHFRNESGGEGSAACDVELSVKPRPGLGVSPGGPLELGWTLGAAADAPPGPATRRSQVYVLENRSARAIPWSAEADVPWLAVGPREGSLAPGERALLQVSIDPARAPTVPGQHRGLLRIRQATAELEPCERLVRLVLRRPDGLLVTPGDRLTLEGDGARSVTLQNHGRFPLRWRAEAVGTGFAPSEASGELDAGESRVIEVRREGGAEPGGALVLVNLTDGVGTTTLSVGGGAEAPRAGSWTTSLSQYGITWTFDRDVRLGRFANGDWWVVGPVTVVDVFPGSRRLGPRVINGSMRNPSPGDPGQGYDSAMFGQYKSPGSYRDGLNVALDVSPARPLVLPAHSSLVSTLSVAAGGARPQVDTAAILTVLAEPAREGSFRPPYCGDDKTPRYHVDDLRRERLLALERVPSTPPLAQVEGWFERPWIDHIPDWVGRYHHPARNMPDYGREICDQVSSASLMLLLDFPLEEKERLLVRFVQLGIDLYGIVRDGGQNNWPPGGGHHSGRKWPILFAGILLDDPDMSSIGKRKNVQFNEDGQTFYVEETSPGVYNEGHGGYGPEHVGLAEWGNQHAKNRSQDDVRWSDPDGTNRHLAYRTCCTANVWWGEVLAARAMGAQGLWDHDALFDYQDRYRAVTRGSGQEGWTIAWSPFQLEMWDRYRPQF